MAFPPQSPHGNIQPMLGNSTHACELCGGNLSLDAERGICPFCGSRPRVRSIARLIPRHISPNLPSGMESEALLAFSITNQERQILSNYFKKIKPVSLYGKFGGEEGVDARNLSRYKDGTFLAVYSCLLYDYFLEHNLALSEAFRVLMPGGIFFTHIERLSTENSEPALLRKIVPKPGYYDYIPAGQTMDSVEVGIPWFLATMRSVGFCASHHVITDSSSKIETHWFVGIKPPLNSLPPASADSTAKTYSIPLPSKVFCAASIRIHLSLPLEDHGKAMARFCHHEGANVIAGSRGGYFRSTDCGQNWHFTSLPGYETVYFSNAKQLNNGSVLLQARGADGRSDIDSTTGLLLLDVHGTVVNVGALEGSGEWHGTSSIDEKDGVIMYADYQPNGSGLPMRDSRVFRSVDGGKSWTTVFSRSANQVRHFHLLRADPDMARTWWLSSGDSPDQSRIWVSRDDGGTWHDMTSGYSATGIGPTSSRSVFRLTDLVFASNGLIWGADDILGADSAMSPSLGQDRRAGSRLFYANRTHEELIPREIGICGQPIRSLVDCGDVGWLVLTQGTLLTHTTRPQVFLLGRQPSFPLFHLFDVDNFRNSTTAFTASCASRTTYCGTFFSARRAGDAFPAGKNILQWRIEVDY